ncbi:MAG: glutathione peroxidase [Myxococcota bacterium]
MTTAHDFSHPDIDGQETSLSAYAGKVKLIVNVASKCGLTPQYTGLEELQKAFGDRGFVVLGFPCNQFGAQEPGSEAEIKTFCSTRYGVSFPMFSKLEVNGAQRHPLYAWLTEQATTPEGPGDISWNFGKFLIGKDGAILGRYSPRTAPAELADAIEAAL